MKPTALLLLCFLLTANFCHAQNLVPNGSFEEYYSCPNSTNQVDSCIGWQRVYKTPDYFSTCASYPVSVPDNVTGSQMPFDGNAYMGLYTYGWSQFYREVIGTQLIDSLIPGRSYNVSMRISRGNWTNMAYNCAASNKMGIRFTTFSYSTIDTPAIDNSTQLYTDSIIADTSNWVLLSWNFIADSFYTYLYIGNFFDDNNTDTLVLDAPAGNFGQAYYYIDSVQVYCADNNCITSTSEIDFNKHIEYLQYSKIIQVNLYNSSVFALSIFNIQGEKVKQIIAEGTSMIDVSDIVTGVYIVNLQLPTQLIKRKIFIH